MIDTRMNSVIFFLLLSSAVKYTVQAAIGDNLNLNDNTEVIVLDEWTSMMPSDVVEELVTQPTTAADEDSFFRDQTEWSLLDDQMTDSLSDDSFGGVAKLPLDDGTTEHSDYITEKAVDNVDDNNALKISDATTLPFRYSNDEYEGAEEVVDTLAESRNISYTDIEENLEHKDDDRVNIESQTTSTQIEDQNDLSSQQPVVDISNFVSTKESATDLELHVQSTTNIPDTESETDYQTTEIAGGETEDANHSDLTSTTIDPETEDAFKYLNILEKIVYDDNEETIDTDVPETTMRDIVQSVEDIDGSTEPTVTESNQAAPNIEDAIEILEYLKTNDTTEDPANNEVDSDIIVDVIRNFIAERDPILELFLSVCFVHPDCLQLESPLPTSELGEEGREILILLQGRRSETARLALLKKIDQVKLKIKEYMFQVIAEQVAKKGVSVVATKNIIDTVKKVWEDVVSDLNSVVTSLQEIFSTNIPYSPGIITGIAQIGDILPRIPRHVLDQYVDAAEHGYSRYRQFASWDSWKKSQ